MNRRILFLFTLVFICLTSNAQDAATLLRNGAVRVDNPLELSDSVYKLLSSFQIIMVGEMHGTNKPAQFVTGLASLYASKGDSVQVGLEILPEQMQLYLSLHTDSSIFKSQFFSNPPQQDGRESFAWANIISKLNDNPRVQIFFFDINKGKEELYPRDSIMFSKNKKQIYGSQVVPDKETGGWKFAPIEDEINVNIRREKIGLEPLEKYAKYFGIDYTLPNK